MASVEANGITIEYEEQGSGDPLLLVMGLNGQLTDWPPELMDLLADQGFRVIRFDNRDAGLSTAFDHVAPPTRRHLVKALFAPQAIPHGYKLSDMAADAVGLLDALDVSEAHVMGVSMGGMISQQVAIDHPTRIKSLVSIMSTTGDRKVGQPKPSITRRFLRPNADSLDEAVDRTTEFFEAISGPHFDSDEFRPVAQASVKRSFRPDGSARQLAAIVASGDRTAGLEQLDLPTLVVHGMVDPLVRPSGGLATAKAVPGSRLLMFNDMGHDLPRPRLEEFAAAIRRNANRA